MNLGSIFFRLGNNQFIISAPPTNQCVASVTVLNPGQICNVGIQFAPSLPNQPNGLRQTGPRTDFLVVQDNAGNTNGSSQQFITLIGNATGVPAATLDKSSLVFPNTAMGSTSVKQTVVLKNTGNNPLLINTPTFRTPADFHLPAASSTPCPYNSSTGLAPGASCNIDITFGPASTATGGTRMDVLTIPTNAGNDNNLSTTTAQQVAVSGVATGGTGTISATVAPNAINFGSQPVATLSTPLKVTITNNSAFPTQISTGFDFSSVDFFVPNNCNNPPVAIGASCILDIYYQPFVVGPKRDNLFIFINGSGTGSGRSITLRIPLQGVGTGTQSVSPSPASLVFGATAPGTIGSSQLITITNNGTAPTAINSIQINPFYNGGVDFTETHNCSLNTFMAVGASCVVNVTFTPAPLVFAPATRTATLFIQGYSNNSNVQTLAGSVLTQQTVALTGTAAGAPVLTFTPTSLHFMHIRGFSGQRSNPLILTITNTGTAPLTPVPAVTNTVGEVIPGSNTCDSISNQTLSVGASCHYWVRYQSSTFGARIDTLRFLGNMNNTPTEQYVPAFAFSTP